jgi:hypothetical protein
MAVVGITDHQCPPHYWMLSDAGGEVCHATCKRCRAKKEFMACCHKDRLGKSPKLPKRAARVGVATITPISHPEEWGAPP